MGPRAATTCWPWTWTLRPVPWLQGTAMVPCGLAWEDGSDVVASPRQILRRQLGRLAERGWSANAGTELEFMVFRETYESAWHKATATRGGLAARARNLYNVDYSMLGTARIEPLIRRIRSAMEDAGMAVENSKGECNHGQHEINFHYADALRTADDHAIYKNAAKEGMAISYMAKFDEREGSSCHIPFSLADGDGRNAFAADEGMFESFLAGQLACLRDLTVLVAPNINSYKRFVEGSFAPTTIAWGRDNRTCALRVVRHGQGLRFVLRAGARTSTRTWRSARSSPPACTGWTRGSSSSPCTRATPTTPPTSPACPRRCATPATCSPPATCHAARSTTRWSITTSTPPTSSSAPSRPRSPAGSASAASSVCRADMRCAMARAVRVAS
jgi:glutamine synthetase